MKYPIKNVYEIETEDGLEWVAEFVDIKGCIGCGDSPQEAVKVAYENLDFHLQTMREEGMAIPRASRVGEEEYSGKLLLRLGKRLHRTLSENAVEDGVSLNSYITSILNEAIGFSKAICTFEKTIHEAVEKSFAKSIITNGYKLADNLYALTQVSQKSEESMCA